MLCFLLSLQPEAIPIRAQVLQMFLEFLLKVF